ALSKILGGPDLYIKTGSTINITCIITESPQPPTFVFWYHNDKVINYDSERGGVRIDTEKSVTTTSQLLLTNAQPADSGIYSCNPSTADAANITVHVLNGEKHAAIQHDGQNKVYGTSVTILSTLFSVLFVTFVPIVR
uniref:Ig-like domain-containing protein n=1 Tax=Strigamia maritima TaxID=126957 RepID=T1JE38_STRMM